MLSAADLKSVKILVFCFVVNPQGKEGKSFLLFFFFFLGWGVTCGPPWDKPEWDRPAARQLTGAEQKRAGVTDGLGLPASQLISSEEKPETRGLKGRRADEQVGRQTDTQANALIGRHPDSRQTHRQMYRQPWEYPRGLELMQTQWHWDTHTYARCT